MTKRALILIELATALLCAACAPAAAQISTAPTRTPLSASQLSVRQLTATRLAVTPLIITLTPAATATPAHPDDHILGPDSAFLAIVMYGDFQCAPCLDVARSVEILRERYQADVRLVWRNFPQTEQNDKALIAAQAAEAAAAQGKFWEMHDQLYTHQGEWAAMTPAQFRVKLTDYVKIVGLDQAAFTEALDSSAVVATVQRGITDAQALQLKGAPVLLFNGQPYSGRIDLYALDDYTQLRLLEKRGYAHQPDLQIDLNKRYTAVLVTEKGSVEIELNAKAAPVTVNNFIVLARDGWYNNITFHLVMPGSLVQTGDPSGSGFGGPGYHIIDEHDNGALFDRAGQVAMASTRGEPNSGGSQFFITLAALRPEADYDKQFTIFGHVTSGLDVLQKLTTRNAFDEISYPNPLPGDKLLSVTIKES